MTPHFFLWCHICLLSPQLPLASPICLYGATYLFLHPICLLQAPPAFLLPIFFEKDPWQHVWQPKGSLILNSQGAICGWYNHHVQQLISSTNCFCKLLQHLFHVSGCASIRVIILFGHIRESSLLDLPRGISVNDVLRKPNIWLGKHTQKLCPLACLV